MKSIENLALKAKSGCRADWRLEWSSSDWKESQWEAIGERVVERVVERELLWTINKIEMAKKQNVTKTWKIIIQMDILESLKALVQRYIAYDV